MSGKILGLDIGRNRVSAVLLKRGVKGRGIKAHFFKEIPPGEDFEKALDGCLKSVVDSMDLSGAVCLAAWPADKISYRNIRVPFTDRKKIRQILPFELESLTPFDADDLMIDFNVVRQSERDAELLVAYMEKSALESLLNILASHHLNPEVVTVGGLPAALSSPGSLDGEGGVLRVDIGSRRATLFAGPPGRADMIRAFPIRSAADARIRSLCRGLQGTLFALEEMGASEPAPARVLITGCDPSDPGVEEEMERLLGIPVVRANFSRDHGFEIKNSPDPAWEPARMNNALALSATSRGDLLNFRKGSFAVNTFWESYSRRLFMIGGLALLVFLAALLNIGLDSYYLTKRLAALDNGIDVMFRGAFPEVQRIEAPLMQARVKLKEAREKYQPGSGAGSGVLVVDVLDAISRRTPAGIDVELQRLVISPGSVLISGHTNAFNAVDAMKSRLEEAEIFKSVAISSANMDKTGDRVHFKLKATTGEGPNSGLVNSPR
ncbi:MAG: pilus assembly protein PilM [Desulfobacterales bacterium]|nr:pilus assembly protein PilM [Desulfobacterales bacterium]